MVWLNRAGRSWEKGSGPVNMNQYQGLATADINGDGYLDAMLRLAPLGHGAIRVPLVLPLTRLSADGPLQVPGAGLAAPAE